MPSPTNADDVRAKLRIAEIREDISTRLWSINRGMSSAVFNSLLDDMARLQFSFEERAAAGMLAADRRLGRTDRRSVVDPLPLGTAARPPKPAATDPLL